jgi:hypothetical protein
MSDPTPSLPIESVVVKTEDGKWAPAVRFDLTSGQQAFKVAVERFREWAKKQPRPELTLASGWHTITPQTAEQLLICNVRNRELKWAEVLRYGTQMANHRWKKTGEPVIITDRGDVEDAGHRLFACYFSNTPFDTYVVADVPHDDQLFAYIDNGVSRTGADTLYCAGVNGLSNHLQTVIKEFCIRYDEGSLTFQGRLPVSPITNADILDYARAHPDLSETAHLVKDLYQAAIRRLDSKSATTFLAWKIRRAHGSGVLEDFMSLLTQGDLPVGHPIRVLQQRLDQHEAAKDAAPKSAKAKQKLSSLKILVLAMRAFNFWRSNVNVQRLDPRMEDPFPRIEPAEESEVAAAAE